MARQHISIGTIANDDTGDSLRVGGDKANDNFIELYSMFDVWPGNFNFWPLGGSTALTSGLTVDGNGNTLDFIDLGGFSVDVGLNNMAFTGSVLSLDATNSIVWNVDDGVDATDIDIDPNSVTVSTTDIHLNTTNSFNASADDGVDSSTLSLTPQGLDIEHFAGGTTDVLSTWQINGASGVDLRIGTGFGSTRFSDVQFGVVDSFSINVNATNSLTVLPTLTTVSAPFQLASYTVATLPAAASYPRCLVWVSDETDGACEAISNGTNWIRTYDGNIVS